MSEIENAFQDLCLDEPDPNEHHEAELTLSAVMSDEEKLWNCQELDQQCKDVLDLLSNNKRRWDHTAGDQGILPLEEYKKRTLAERKGDSNEPTRVTALHVLARLKQEFDAARKDVCEQLVRHLLENRVDSADESHSPEGNKRMLVLQVALIYENHKFILCVEECLRADFPDFLHLQDDAGRNCLHHLFAWPLERFGRAPLGRKSPGDNKLYLDQLNMLALKAEQRTLAAADKEGNTPIHYAMHAKQCYDRGDEYVNIVMILILRADEAMIKNNTVFNKNRESPVMYCRNILDAVKKEMKPNNKSKQAQVPVQATKAPNALSQMQSRGGQVDGSGPTKKSHKLVSHDAAAGTQYSSHGMENNINYPAMGSQGPTPKTPTTPTITATVPEGHRLQKAPTFGPSQDSALIQCQSQMLPPGKKREPPTTSAQAKDGRNAGDTKTASRDTASPAKTAISSMRAVQRLSNFLKMHYTGTRSDLSARDIIYGRGDDGWAKNLYFDARGLQETTKVLELLERMEAGGFAATLSYVSIPALRHVPAIPPLPDYLDSTGRGVPPENPRLGRTDLIDVFNKLNDLEVTYIWRLEVEDRQRPSHTDAAIERAIQGRDPTVDQVPRRPISIHTWDWRKLDLSTDVIAFAAPTVKVVNLYWSGNQTVLTAWGCSEGIPRLHSITAVQKIFIHATPGLETMDRMNKAIRRFKDALEVIFPNVVFVRPTPGRKEKDALQKKLTQLEESLKEGYSKVVEIEFAYHVGELFPNVDSGEEIVEYIDDPTARQHAWVDAMDKFRGALASMLPPLYSSKNRVRVALIDDGVNLGSVDMFGKIVNVTGLSFHPSDRQTENPWHCSSGGHGTVMANMILRINPWVDLIVIKLHCGVSHNQGRTISARSAAEAIRAAIDLKVKIISVSWTIKYRGITGTSRVPSESDPSKPVKKDDFTQLTEAIDEVKNRGILMFCSASDDIQTTAMKALPYSQQPEHIYRIGAALWLGQRDPTTETPDRIDWYFPGNQVAEAKNPRSQGPVKYHDGSSAGTALAAGLASLIMFLARLVQARYSATKNMSQAKAFEGFADGLENRTKMKQALDMISKKGNYQQDRKYLPVWDTFNSATEILMQSKDDKTKWEELARLVRSLCADVVG